MAKKNKRKGLSGFNYIGKKVEVQDIRFDKSVFIEKNKSEVGGALTSNSYNSDGKVIKEFQGRKQSTFSDDTADFTASSLISSGFLSQTITADRTKRLPAWSEWSVYLTERFSAFDFVIVNLSSNFSLTAGLGSDTTHFGDFVVRPNTSGFFRVISTAVDGSSGVLVRLASDNTTGAAATTSSSGIVELATTAETTTGTDTDRAVTPDGLKDGYQGSTNVVTLGTITTGTWTGTQIDGDYLTGTPQFAAIELGHANDTTIERSASGKITVEGAAVQTTQIVTTHHHFFMNSSSTTGDFFFPYNNLNEASSTSQYYTRTIAPYAGKIVKVVIRPTAAIGTACKLQFHKITDTTATFGTAIEEVTNINLNTAETSVSTAFSSATFDAGDVVNVSLIKSDSGTANIQAVIVWEYTV